MQPAKGARSNRRLLVVHGGGWVGGGVTAQTMAVDRPDAPGWRGAGPV